MSAAPAASVETALELSVLGAASAAAILSVLRATFVMQTPANVPVDLVSLGLLVTSVSHFTLDSPLLGVKLVVATPMGQGQSSATRHQAPAPASKRCRGGSVTNVPSELGASTQAMGARHVSATPWEP